MKDGFNTYGERKLIYKKPDASSIVNDQTPKSIDDIIRSDYPKSGLSNIKGTLNYAVNRKTIFVVNIDRLFE